MTRSSGSLLAALSLMALSVAACDFGDEGTTTPEPTGESLWQHLQGEDYTQNWQRWPGTEALYEGSDPHGMLLTTYVNDIAREAITNQNGIMSDGAIIVKENYMPDSTFGAVTTMYKVDGYNPEHHDWFGSSKARPAS